MTIQISSGLRRKALAVLVASAALSTAVYASHAWGPYHWARTSNPFTLQVGNNLTTADWKGQLLAASADWNSPTTFGALSTPVVTAVVNGTAGKRCSMVAGTTQVCNGRYGSNGWLGLASINISGGEHITQGTAKMNDTYFDTTKYNNPNERRHVMCQEVAHTFGLGHQSENGSSLNTCMDYFSNTGANATSTLSTRPNKHDFDQLNLIYSNVDSSSTVAATSATARAAAAAAAAAAGGVDITDDPGSWGQLVSQSAGGRGSIYERYNANGSKTVTHVFWTEEATERCPGCDHRYEH